MSFVIGLVVGMFAGSFIVIVVAALMAASRSDEPSELKELREQNRRYVQLLEQQVFFIEDDE